MSKSDFNVAIIGAGLSGLALVLALHKQGISCTLFETRDAPLNTGGGLMLTPNGLKVLQSIGVYDSLLDSAYSFDKAFLQMGPTGEIIETFPYGSVEKHGMNALRAFRYALLESLLAEVRRQGIPIHFNRRFSHVMSETDEEVTWQFADGTSSSASILVGADGIHSTVRKYIAPGIEPSFGGYVILVAAIPTSQLGLPAKDLEDLNNASNKYPLPSGIVVPQLGAFVAAP